MLYSMYLCIAYILGILWGLNLSFLSFSPFCFLVICMLTFYYFKNKYNYKKNIFFAYIFLLFILVGLINTQLRMNLFQSKYSNGTIYSSGTINRLLKEGDYYNKYLFKCSNGDKMLLFIPNSTYIPIDAYVSFKGNFELPNSVRNRGGYDYSKYLYSQNIYGSIYIKNVNDIEIIEVQYNLINKIRYSILSVFGKLLPQDEMRNSDAE